MTDDSYDFVLCNPAFSLKESLETKSTVSQKKTEGICYKVKKHFEENLGKDGPLLARQVHIEFLLKLLNDGLPGDERFTRLEGSRTLLSFWCVHSLRILNHIIEPSLIDRIVTFVQKCQKPTGGFSGSPSHSAEMLTTCAAVMTLASIGTEDALKIINRKSMYEFILSLKQPNGSFAMHKVGESDTRAVYCAVAVASLLKIMDSKLFEGTPEWIKSCQTYEGGFAGEPFNEAHGGYNYCGVAALAILGKLNMINIDKLVKWCAARQMSYEGGFQGRPNKLVDSCYSFWVAAAFPILDYEINKINNSKCYNFGGIFEPEGLQWCLLELCQNLEYGGICDKPEMNSDPLHTCYGLAGLSIAQHYSMREKKRIVGGKDNTVEQINPLYNIVSKYYQLAIQYFEKQPDIAISVVNN